MAIISIYIRNQFLHSSPVWKLISRIPTTYNYVHVKFPQTLLNSDHTTSTYYFLLSLWIFTFSQNSGLQISRTNFLGFFHKGRSTALKTNPARRLNVVLKCYHSYKYLNNTTLCNRSISKLKKPISPEWPA